MMTAVGAETVRDSLVGALHAAADFNSADVVGPVALLWPDADLSWADVVSALSSEIGRAHV